MKDGSVSLKINEIAIKINIIADKIECYIDNQGQTPERQPFNLGIIDYGLCAIFVTF